MNSEKPVQQVYSYSFHPLIYMTKTYWTGFWTGLRITSPCYTFDLGFIEKTYWTGFWTGFLKMFTCLHFTFEEKIEKNVEL